MAGAVAVRRAMRVQQQADAEADAAAHHVESLTDFHARVTSADNASFCALQEEERIARQRQQRIAYGSWAAAGRAHDSSSQQPPRLPPSNTYVASPLPLAASAFTASPHRPTLQQQQQQAAAQPLTDGLLLMAVAPPAPMPDTLLLEDDHSSMPPPARQAQTSMRQTLQQPPSSTAVAVYESSHRDKRIVPAATRFPTTTTTTTLMRRTAGDGLNLEESSTDAQSHAYDASDAATDASTDLDAPLDPLPTERWLGQRRQMRAREALVALTPLVQPGTAAAPLLTWGAVAATPLVVRPTANEYDDNDFPASRSPGPAFCLPAESRREQAAEGARVRLEGRRRAAHPSALRRKQLLAAPPVAARAASSFGSALRASYTPRVRSGSATASSGSSSLSRRPGHVHRATPTLRSTKAASSTPSRAAATVTTTEATASSSKDVTKGLLHL
jgi:hypothetical protein